jgi:competence protein ComEC
LIDGGGSPQQLFNQLGVAMPFWDHDIDMMVMTNPDKDHMGAQVETPARFALTTALQTKASAANHDADQWRANLAAAGVTLQETHQGAWFDLGDGVALWVLWPPPEPFGMNGSNTEQYIDNENSLIMKLVYGEFSVLLTGDAGFPAEEKLLAAGAPLTATVLKVGHHGSKGSTGSAFVHAVNPAVAVIQVGADNDYGHPHQETLQRLLGSLVLRNDLHGRIHIYSDGRRMWFETEKGDLSLKD